MKKNFAYLSASVNLAALVLAFFFGAILKLPSLAGVVLLTVTLVISAFLDSRRGLAIGGLNAVLIAVIVLFYYSRVHSLVKFHHFIFTLPLFLIGGYFAGKYNEIKTAYSRKLEKEVKERTKELEEANAVLEIKVRARTRALEEEKELLDEKVKKRTKELQARIDELERFHRLTVGRELKMIELKKEIKRLKEKSEKYKILETRGRI